MLQKDRPTTFDDLADDERQSFLELKKRLVSPPVFALPRPNGRYVIDTDACEYQVGCVLLQEQEGQLHPIGYWSRSLTKAERAYDTTQRECLAVVWAIFTLRPYLEMKQFTLRTDHDSLRWILNLSDATGRLARWRLRLADYDYTVEHRRGIVHQAADALSRLPSDGMDETPLDDEIPLFLVDTTSNQRDLSDLVPHDVTDYDFLDETVPTAEEGHQDNERTPVLTVEDKEVLTEPVT